MTGRIVAIEGGDGAGKRTTSEAIVVRLREIGLKADVISFPRYGSTVGANVIGDFLSHRIKASLKPNVLAVFYAADRLQSLGVIERARELHDFVIMDRYVGSNVAYQASKVLPSEMLGTMRWIERLELEIFGIPPPELSVLLRMPVMRAKELVSLKAGRSYTDQVFDRHEADEQLQSKIYDSYSVLIKEGIISPWLDVNPLTNGRLRPPLEIANEILRALGL
jgi:dTMP kinase